MRINNTDANSVNAEAFLTAMRLQTILITRIGWSARLRYQVGTLSNFSTYAALNITYLDSVAPGTFTDGDDCTIAFTGDLGPTGPTGPTGPSGSISWPLLAPNGSIAAPSYAASDSPGSGIFFGTTGNVAVSVNGSMPVVISESAATVSGYLAVSNSRTGTITGSNAYMYRTAPSGGIDFPFTGTGHLVIQGRSDTAGHIVFMAGNPSAPILTLNGSTGALMVEGAGTAGSPAITNRADSNTGIYWPGSDQIAMAVGGVARLTVTSNGIRLDRPVILTQTTGSIRSSTNTNLTTYAGGTNENSGANVILYGPNHSTQPGVGWLRGGTSQAARWQGSTFTVPTTLVIPVK